MSTRSGNATRRSPLDSPSPSPVGVSCSSNPRPRRNPTMTSELKEKLQTVQAAQAVDRPSQSSVLSLLQDGRIKVQLARALPRAITADRFMRIVLTEVRQNPRLLEC